jgi:hypothetical protein
MSPMRGKTSHLPCPRCGTMNPPKKTMALRFSGQAWIIAIMGCLFVSYTLFNDAPGLSLFWGLVCLFGLMYAVLSKS